jgi:hypothetical protein
VGLVALFLVAGISGSGKSAVCSELKARGYVAYDSDEEGFCGWQERASGEWLVRDPEFATPERRGRDFYERFGWAVHQEMVLDLVVRAEQQCIFLCGSVAQDEAYWGRFGGVICLDADVATICQRLDGRVGNDFGKTAHERAMVLAWHTSFREELVGLGAVVVDTGRPLDAVVDEILGIAARW